MRSACRQLDRLTAGTAAVADPLPDVQRAEGVRWEWDADGPVRDVRAAGTGATVASSYGTVVGLG